MSILCLQTMKEHVHKRLAQYYLCWFLIKDVLPEFPINNLNINTLNLHGLQLIYMAATLNIKLSAAWISYIFQVLFKTLEGFFIVIKSDYLLQINCKDIYKCKQNSQS